MSGNVPHPGLMRKSNGAPAAAGERPLIPPQPCWLTSGLLLHGSLRLRLHCLGILLRAFHAATPAPTLLLVSHGKLFLLGHPYHLLSSGSVSRRFNSRLIDLAALFLHSGKLLFQLIPVVFETLQLFLGRKESTERWAASAASAHPMRSFCLSTSVLLIHDF